MDAKSSTIIEGPVKEGAGEATGDDAARNRLIKARADMVLAHPFFASLSLRLDLKEDRKCATAWTDGEVMGYNPDYIKVLSDEKLVGLAAHTVMHPACNHHKRLKNREPKLWNKACDYVINPILLNAGLTLPDGFLWDPVYEGKTADAVYTLLKEGEGQGEKGENQQENPNPEKGNQKKEEMEEGPSTKGTERGADDPENSDPGMAGEIRENGADPKTATGKSRDETDWEQALVQAAANARAMGHLPRGIDLFVKETVSPCLPWQELLSLFIQQSAKMDYSWARPNRRYIHQGLYFPSLVSDQLPELAVAIDTSGSIQPRELDRFGAELSAILSMNPSRIHLIYSDFGISRYQVVEPWDLPIEFSPKGGGGTDFRPVFEFLDKKGITPYCLIYLTDLECRLFPPAQPGFPVLWVKTGQGGVKPPFGRQILMKP